MPDKFTLRRNFYISKYKALNSVLALVILLTFGISYAPLSVVLVLNICSTLFSYQTLRANINEDVDVNAPVDECIRVVVTNDDSTNDERKEEENNHEVILSISIMTIYRGVMKSRNVLKSELNYHHNLLKE